MRENETGINRVIDDKKCVVLFWKTILGVRGFEIGTLNSYPDTTTIKSMIFHGFLR
jgi:hypothetical protein